MFFSETFEKAFIRAAAQRLLKGQQGLDSHGLKQVLIRPPEGPHESIAI